MNMNEREVQAILSAARNRARLLCGAAMLLVGGTIFLASRPAAVAQGHRQATPVVITSFANNNSASVDSAGRLTVVDPRMRVDEQGRLRVVSDDPCCPKP